jgi:tetratricopeptide (TPR) repeat protein
MRNTVMERRRSRTRARPINWAGGKNPIFAETLASAYAESGDFAKAREYQEKAIELAPEEVKPKFRAPLELYKQGKPFRVEPVKK